MKKSVLLVFIICICLTSTMVSQQSISDPINTVYRTTHSLYLPNEFLLFTPDTLSQILFNPSRGASYNGQFVYLSNFASPTSTSQNIGVSPLLSLATLFNSMGSKWLLVVEYGNEKQDQAQESLYSSGGIYHTINSSSNTANQNDLRVKLANLDGLIIKNSSIAIIFDVFCSNIERNDYNEILQWTGLSDHLSMAKHNSKTDYKKYKLGLEYSFFNESIDYTGSINLQRTLSDDQSSALDSQKYIYYDTLPAPTSTSYLNESASTITRKPSTFSTSHFLSYKSRCLFDDEHIFVSLNGYYSDDKYNSNQHFTYLDDHFYQDGKDSSDNDVLSNFAEINKGLNLSFGYAFKLSLKEFSFLGGIILNHNMSEFTSNEYNITNPKVNRSKLVYSVLTLPATLYYNINESIRIYGGISYSCFNRTFKTERNGLQLPSSLNNSKNIYAESYTNTYLGADVILPMNFKVHAFFGDDLASYKNWSVSLGYYF